MVGRLVEQQQIGLTPGDQRQRQPGLFTAREIENRLIAAITAKVETTEEITQYLFTFARGDALQMQQRTGLGIQSIELMLGKIADNQVFTTLQTPR